MLLPICPEVAQRTLRAIIENPKATISQLDQQLNFSERTVKNHIALLKKANIIERVGSDTRGSWKVFA